MIGCLLIGSMIGFTLSTCIFASQYSAKDKKIAQLRDQLASARLELSRARMDRIAELQRDVAQQRDELEDMQKKRS